MAAEAVQHTRDIMNFGNSRQFDLYESSIGELLSTIPYVLLAVMASSVAATTTSSLLSLGIASSAHLLEFLLDSYQFLLVRTSVQI